jgi:DNA-binding response OmpR family regulator
MGKIIVVDDDADLRKQVVDYLKMAGMDASGVGSAVELYRRMAVETFDVLVLDLRLPDEDGLSIASYIRSHTGMGIIMVTSKGEAEDKVRGREAGADVYLPKPVDLRELVAAINSLSDRLAAKPETPASAVQDAWVLSLGGFRLSAPNGKSAPLTANELALLRRLASSPGAAVPRGQLLAVLGYPSDDPSNRNLDASLRRLRLKVGDMTGLQLPLRTVHSVGYLISAEMLMID